RRLHLFDRTIMALLTGRLLVGTGERESGLPVIEFLLRGVAGHRSRPALVVSMAIETGLRLHRGVNAFALVDSKAESFVTIITLRVRNAVVDEMAVLAFVLEGLMRLGDVAGRHGRAPRLGLRGLCAQEHRQEDDERTIYHAPSTSAPTWMKKRCSLLSERFC